MVATLGVSDGTRAERANVVAKFTLYTRDFLRYNKHHAPHHTTNYNN
jgi:hypothetical protein